MEANEQNRDIYMDHLKKIDELLLSQNKFISELPETISKEIKNAFMLNGIDSGNPQEMQELIIWAKRSKKRDDQIKERSVQNTTDIVFKIIGVLIILGFFSFYTNHQIKVAIRDSTPKIETVKKTAGEE